MNMTGSNQSLSWVRPKENARFFANLFDSAGANAPRIERDDPLELLPDATMNIHHLGRSEVDLIDGVLDLPANTPVRVASLKLADWFVLSTGQYTLEIGPQLFHVNPDGQLTPFDCAFVGTNITVDRPPPR
jgi:hypothetical protein